MEWIEAELRHLIENAPPMTAEQLFEQKVSFVFGQIGGPLTKHEVRNILRKQIGLAPSPRSPHELVRDSRRSEMGNPRVFRSRALAAWLGQEMAGRPPKEPA